MADGILIAGLVMIFVSAEVILRGAVGIARQFDMPPLYTGIFVVAVLTVFPELFVTYRAATMGRPEMALGGIIGSNLIDLLLVMGLGALIHPMAAPPKVLFRDGGALLVGAVLLVIISLTGELTRQFGIVLLLASAAYVGLIAVTDWRRTPDHSVPTARALFRSEGEMPSLLGAFVLLVLGLIALALGAHLAVLGGIHLAREIGWSETTIGLTLIAAGLSSPKLLVTLTAAVRGQTSIAVGQILGACAFNLLLVLGLVAVIQPFAVPEQLRKFDVFLLAGASFILLPLIAMRWRLSRPRGVLLMIAYGCYLAFILVRQGLPLPVNL
ncbi:cation:H+ antiporter [Rhizomicrobium palustre]|uniref:Cation:H+ antiporter n=1 Tax=Rhizomicrobium palustre TaxID=189966 RepID=A0A846N296_9PROT|nr:sodium:calcium antiporter [Rhizomicrobium palustre]NIK89733.1 cation:H+ antiporter [Rhizomicrobium palustre]